MDNQEQANPPEAKGAKKAPWTARVTNRAMAAWRYLMGGVWSDPRRSWKVTTVKTLNLGIRSFTDSDLQVRAASLTYNTVLAVVPVLAMIFAIGRGFGFQRLLQDQLYNWFPNQHKLAEMALRFVDSYLAQSSEGIFVGVGLVFLLWTMISLLGNVEDAFNIIWDVKNGRSIWRKITDYLAIFLVLPILMIIGGGLSILMSTTLHNLLPLDFLTPAIDLLLDIASLAFTWLFFAAAYMLIPNARVRFVNALIAGAVTGCAMRVLQWLFLTGQIYVAKYNAIYGSFSFLPLFLIWLDLTWLITLTGAVLCYASQNIVSLSFVGQIDHISANYRTRVSIVVMTIICRRFREQLPPLSPSQMSKAYSIPMRLIKDITAVLVDVGLLNRVLTEGCDEEDEPLQPAVPVDTLLLSEMLERVRAHGESGFIPRFNERFEAVNSLYDKIAKLLEDSSLDVRFIDIPVNLNPSQP